MTNLELPCGGTTIKRVNTRSVYKLLDEMGVSDTYEVSHTLSRHEHQRTRAMLSVRNSLLSCSAKPCCCAACWTIHTIDNMNLLHCLGSADMAAQVDYERFRYSVVTLSRKDLTTVTSYWSKCYVAGPYGDSSLDSGASTTDNSVGHMLGGFFAGIVAKTASSPLEVTPPPPPPRRPFSQKHTHTHTHTHTQTYTRSSNSHAMLGVQENL